MIKKLDIKLYWIGCIIIFVLCVYGFHGVKTHQFMGIMVRVYH